MAETRQDQLPPSAAEIRATIAEREAEKLRREMEKRKAAEAERADRLHHFFNDPLTEDEVEVLRTRMRAAIERGDLEVLIAQFPASWTPPKTRAFPVH